VETENLLNAYGKREKRETEQLLQMYGKREKSEPRLP